MLTLQFIPYADLEPLQSDERIERLLALIKEEKILLLEGRLKPAEEAELIRRTMEQIDNRFKGIEISPINIQRKEDAELFHSVRAKLISLLLGDRQGLTIIGPASIVKEIKQDPDKIQLFTEEHASEDSKKRKK